MIMDKYLECRYELLKRASNDPKVFQEQKLKAEKTKCMATILASWLMEKKESTFLKAVEEKLAEGYKPAMFSVWKLSDQEGNLVELSTEPQKASRRRPWRRGWSKGMMNKDGKKWIL